MSDQHDDTGSNDSRSQGGNPKGGNSKGEDQGFQSIRTSVENSLTWFIAAASRLSQIDPREASLNVSVEVDEEALEARAEAVHPDDLSVRLSYGTDLSSSENKPEG